MEGDRLLAAISKGERLEKVSVDVQNYVGPLSSDSNKIDVEKYQHFALRALKLTIQALTNCKSEEKKLSILQISEILMLSIGSKAIVNEKITPFSFEKLLINLLSQAAQTSALDVVVKCCTIIKDRLGPLIHTCSNEARVLMKTMADVLWQSVLQVEQRHKPEQVLDMRRLSIEGLLTSGVQLKLLADRAIKADLQYSRVARLTVNSTCPYLTRFHECCLGNNSFLSCLQASDCDGINLVCVWLMLAYRSCLKQESMCNNHISFKKVSEAVTSHSDFCVSPSHPLLKLSVALVHILDHFITSSSTFPSSLISQCSSSLLVEDTVNASLSTLTVISEIIETIVNHATHSQRRAKKSSKEPWISYQCFKGLKMLVLHFVKFIDLQLEAVPKAKLTNNGNVLECSSKSRQIFLLNALMTMLLDLVMADTSSRDDVLEECLPLARRLEGILNSCARLSNNEHKWFGYNVYNLGFVLFKKGNVWHLATALLKMACDHLCHWCQSLPQDDPALLAEVNLVNKYSLLISCYHTSEEPDVAMGTIKSMLSTLPVSLLQHKDSVRVIVSDFVKTKRQLRKKDPENDLTLSVNDILVENGCSSQVVTSSYLEEELMIYEGLKEDVTIWELHAATQLLTIYKELPSSSLNFARLLIKQASLYNQLGSELDHQILTHSPLDMISEAIRILESAQAGQHVPGEKLCVTFDLLGWGYLLKAICLHTKLISSRSNSNTLDVLNDGPVVMCLNSAVISWSKLYGTITSYPIPPDACETCFHHFQRTCDHLRLCVSLCQTLSLVPLSLNSLDTLISLCQWNKEEPHAVALVPSLLACKAHLLLTSYGEGYVDMGLVSALEGFVEKEGAVGDTQRLECLLALAFLRCGRGEFSCCNELLRSALSSPLLTKIKNTPDVHRLMSLLASVSSQYIQAQSQYLPLMDVTTCLNNLTSSPSPVCISCIKESQQKCSSCAGSPNSQVSLTELELALDSLNLTKGLSHLCAIQHGKEDHTHQSGPDSDDTLSDDLPNTTSSSDGPTSPLVSSPSAELWNTVYELLSGLLRVAELFAGREAIKEAVHYATEGLEVAKQLCLKYWQVKFLLLLSTINDSADCVSAGDELREKVGVLLELSQDDTRHPEDETSELTKRIDSLSINTESNDLTTPTEFHSSSCQCVCCINPVRVVLVLHYLHQLIKRRGCAERVLLLQQQQHASLDTGWFRACKNLAHSGGSEPKRKQKTRGRRKKDAEKESDSSMDLKKKSELVLPFEVRKVAVQIETLLMEGNTAEAVHYGEQALSSLESTVLLYLHVPEVRLAMAELHYILGKAKLQITDDVIGKAIYEGACPMNFSPELSATGMKCINSSSKNQGRVRKARPVRSRRRIIDSDEEEQEGSQDAQSTLPNGHTPSLIPEPLLPFVSHFISSYQLLSPTSLSVHLCRLLYHYLGVCLSIWRTDLAAHFIVSTSYLSLSLDAVLWTSKKTRHHYKKKNKRHLVELILKDIRATLFPSLPMVDQSDLPLTQASAILQHLTHPLPLSYTSELINHLPPDWLFCNLSVVERAGRKGEKVMVLVRMSKGSECIVVKVPVDIDTKFSDYNDVLVNSPLEQFHSIMAESLQSAKLTEKRKWWGTRRKLDSQMKELLEALEVKWFHCWKFLLISSDMSLTEQPFSKVKSILSNCGVASPGTWAKALIRSGHILSRDDVMAVLNALTSRKYNVDSVDKVYKLLQQQPITVPAGSSMPSPLILSLGHPLHQLPLENMSMLQDLPVSRIPSLPFLAAHLVLQSNRGFTNVNPQLTYYIVNPSGDLKNTEKVFAKWFEKEDGWEGVVGRPPTSEQFVYGFERRRVLIYCGHGRAREYLKRGHIQELDCQAALLQMGCSSGKLQSPGGDLEPTGMVFHFLLAGCPSLVVNLWDVTDVDIDRFCSTVVKEWLSGEIETDLYKLLQVLPGARNSCKLRYLVGASPVVYGLPVIGTETQ